MCGWVKNVVVARLTKAAGSIAAGGRSHAADGDHHAADGDHHALVGEEGGILLLVVVLNHTISFFF